MIVPFRHVGQGAWIALCEMEADESVKWVTEDFEAKNRTFKEVWKTSFHGKSCEMKEIAFTSFFGMWVSVIVNVTSKDRESKGHKLFNHLVNAASFCWVVHIHQHPPIMKNPRKSRQIYCFGVNLSLGMYITHGII